ncbi:MAG: transporter [Phycisphaerales bacterium]|nr:transporter [Phycisphaerales bacterium]
MGQLRSLSVLILSLWACSINAHAQAPINSNVALQPAKDGWIVRQQFRYASSEFSSAMGELEIEQTLSITTLVYGLSEKVTLIFDMPYVVSSQIENQSTSTSTSDSGFGDLKLLAELRIYRDDFAPGSTARFALIGGAELPSGADAFSSDSVDPILGGVYSYINERHAFHADVLWKFNTGSSATNADVLQYDLAYSYRLTPETYDSEKPTALFAGLELNGVFETNQDNELFLSPGLQYVTQHWIVEATVQLPIWQSLNDRAERDFVVGVGIRFQF